MSRKLDLDRMKNGLNDQIHQLNNAIASTKTYDDELKLFDKLLGSLLKNPGERGGSSALRQLRILHGQIERRPVPKIDKDSEHMQASLGFGGDSLGNQRRKRRYGSRESEKIPLKESSINNSGFGGASKEDAGKLKAGGPNPVILLHESRNF